MKRLAKEYKIINLSWASEATPFRRKLVWCDGRSAITNLTEVGS
jgi:hypothetical protein